MNATAERIETRSCECPVEGCKCTRQTTEDRCAPCAHGLHSDEDLHPLCRSTICRRNTILATHTVAFVNGDVEKVCSFCATGWKKSGCPVAPIPVEIDASEVPY